MKFGKTIKRIVALGIGASFVGATILGASAAASLNQYPAPFVANGKFSGMLVVGDNAAAEDVIGVSDIAMTLQYASAVKSGTGSGSASVSVEGDAYLIKNSGSELNMFEPVEDVRSSDLTSDNLQALADGTFKAKSTEKYTQKLGLTKTSEITYDVDADHSDDPALYAQIMGDENAFDYKLDFDTAVESDNNEGVAEDFEDKKISILGKDYTITEATVDTDASADEELTLTLMSGAIQDTLEVAQTKTYTINGKEYEVTVQVVSGDTSANAEAKLIINGESTPLMQKGDTETLADGIDIGIKEVIPTKSGDVVQNLVEFYLGAQKMVLNGNGNVDIGDETSVPGATVTWDIPTADANTVEWSSMELTIDTEGDNVFVPVGGTFSEAAKLIDEDYSFILDKLGIDYKFGGLAASSQETLTLKATKDEQYELDIKNINGVEYKIPIAYLAGAGDFQFGDKDGEIFAEQNGGDCLVEDEMFVSEFDEESKVWKVDNIKTSGDKEVTIKNLGGGEKTVTATANKTIELDSNVQVKFDYGANCILLTATTDDSDNIADIYTKYGSSVLMDNSAKFTFVEDEDGYADEVSGNDTAKRFSFAWSDGDDNDVLEIPTSGWTISTGLGLDMQDWDSKDDYKTGYTRWGNFVELDGAAADQATLKMTIPESEANALLYVTAGTTSISQSDVVSGDTVVQTPIEIGATKLASEAIEMGVTTKNVLLVGGPCANAAVEAASNKFPTCSAWPYAAGEAVIQLVEQADGHVALLVAGTNAADTRTATKVVAAMKDLKALPTGVTKQKVTIGSSGKAVLSNVVEATPTPAPTATPEASVTE